MTPTLKADLSQFSRAMRQIATAARVPVPRVVRSETESILNRAAQLTGSATVRDIDEGTRKKYRRYRGGEVGAAAVSGLPYVQHTPGTGRVWWVDRNAKGDRTFYVMNGRRRWSDTRWREFEAEEADREADLKVALVEMRRRRGLAKQSWHILIVDLRLKSKVPAYARKAKVNGRMLLQNISAMIRETPDGITLEGINRQPGAVAQDAETRILDRAISGRIRYFEKSLEKGVFDSLTTIAKRYPGLAVG